MKIGLPGHRSMERSIVWWILASATGGLFGFALTFALETLSIQSDWPRGGWLYNCSISAVAFLGVGMLKWANLRLEVSDSFPILLINLAVGILGGLLPRERSASLWAWPMTGVIIAMGEYVFLRSRKELAWLWAISGCIAALAGLALGLYVWVAAWMSSSCFGPEC